MEEIKRRKSILRQMVDKTVMLALIPAIFYFMGVTYHKHYMGVLGIPRGMFPVSFEEAIIMGFQVGLDYVKSFMPRFFEITFAFLGVLLVYGFLFLCAALLRRLGWPRLEVWLRKQIGEFIYAIKFRHSSKRRTDSIYSLVAVVLNFLAWRTVKYFLLFLLPILLILLTQLGALKKADKNAKDYLERVNSALDDTTASTVKGMVMLTVANPSNKSLTTTEGFLALSNEQYCAIFAEDGIIIIPREKIHSLRFVRESKSSAAQPVSSASADSILGVTVQSDSVGSPDSTVTLTDKALY